MFKSVGYILPALIIMTIISCNENSEKQTIAHNPKDSMSKPIFSDSVKAAEKVDLSTKKDIGVVALKEGYKNGKLQMYNADKTVWKSFAFTDDFTDKSIAPFSMKPESRILVFRCVGKTNDMYAVVVNEDKGITKYIKQSDINFSFKTWPQHIVQVFSVDFDYKTNPIKTSPSEAAASIEYDKEEFYHPLKVEGEWLKIEDDNGKSGWIKWRDKNENLIITLYYEA